MRRSRPFLVALAISFALHLLAISGPGWNLPTLDELLAPDEGPPLEAHLVAHPGPVVAAPARPRPQKRPRPAAAPQPDTGVKVSPGGTPPAPDERAGDAAVTDAAPAAEPVAPLPAVAMTLPGYVRIQYRVTMGEGGFPIGLAVEEVRHDGSSYSMRNTAETTGIVSLFRPVKIVNVSAGDIERSGLRPREFWSRRDNGKGDAAHLDWDAGEVRLSDGKRYPLEAGTQDMLSMFAQLALVDTGHTPILVPVATGKKVERYEFVVIGEEKIATPRGERLTLHLRNRQPNGKEATEVWLGLDDARLPIKIRHIDRRGDIFDQTAERIDFEEGQR